MGIMNTEVACPLKQLKLGDVVENVYISGTSPFLRTIFRLNCSHCAGGFVDVLASQAQILDPDQGRYTITVERVRGEVQGCLGEAL
jgi:hypothetical protein